MILNYFCRVTHPGSGRTLDVYTNQPGVQFYTGNFLDSISGKDGAVYGKHNGFCLETQNYPNAPNEVMFMLETIHLLYFKISLVVSICIWRRFFVHLVLPLPGSA